MTASANSMAVGRRHQARTAAPTSNICSPSASDDSVYRNGATSVRPYSRAVSTIPGGAIQRSI